MNKTILLLLSFYVSVCTAMAVPAHKGKVSVKQPDGSTVTIRLHGDEYMSFTTTEDGYTVVKNDKGYYCYAVKQGSTLTTTDIVAHDSNMRDAKETAFLAQQAKMQHADMTAEQLEFKKRSQALWNGPKKVKNGASAYNYSNFKGLIILVEYSDRPFQRSDANAFYNDMMNAHNFEGYYEENSTRFTQCTGSVRDYYYDNSNGIFDPTFDVVGPIQVSKVTTDAHKTSNFYPIAKEALQKANDQVNYADYDTDNDGAVDMVYFIVSGYGSNYDGNNQDYLWPYASDLSYYSYVDGLKFDNKRFGRYACSVEMGGYEEYADYPDYSYIDGIGTICHEFSHVLGLADHYDTNYEEDGESNDPGEWDVMSGGSYLNNSRTPAGYNAYEKYSLGFLSTLNYINEENEYTLNPLNTSNEALRLNTKVNKEFFILENRQKTEWDKYLPGHGMLIWRVDSTNTAVWRDNEVNCNPNHNYFELLRAKNGKGAKASDAFPGTGRVREINNETSPSLKTWSGKESDWVINSITESNGVITFSTASDAVELESDNEPFESLDVTTADATALEGVFCKWDLAGATIVETGTDYGNGNRAVKIERNGTLTSSKIRKPINKITLKFWNTGTNPTSVYFATSTDGSTWTNKKELNADALKVSISAGSSVELVYQLDETEPGTFFRIQNKPTTKNVLNYIDDITITYNPGEELPEDDPIVNGIEQVTAMPKVDCNNQMYNLSGQKVNSSYRGIVIINGKKVINR